MQTIKILIPTHVVPSTQTVTTIFFQNLVPFLKTMFNVELIWLVYTPEKILSRTLNTSNELILDIHDFRNATEVIGFKKPDLIYSSPNWSFIDYSLSSAAKKFNIPVFFMMPAHDPLATKKTTLKNIQSNFSRFVENSTPVDTDNDERKFMKRGRFFIFKYIFLLKTKFALRDSIFHTIFSIWKYVLTDTNNPNFAPDTIQFLENEELQKRLLDLGFKKSNLIVTGNPVYDNIFKKIHGTQSVKNKLTRILFTPSTLYEHGFWTLEQRNKTIKEIVKQISENKTFELSIKIHPSTSIISEYESIVHSINPKIPIFQKGTVEDFLPNVDVVISSQSSSAEIYALLANKRIVICNFFDSEDDLFVKKGIAVSCKHPSEIIHSIKKAETLESYQKNRENFIHEFLFKWDGKSSERICNHLTNIL